MSVLRCDGCFETYPNGTATVSGTDHLAPAVLAPEEVGEWIDEGWTVTVHHHQEEPCHS